MTPRFEFGGVLMNTAKVVAASHYRRAIYWSRPWRVRVEYAKKMPPTYIGLGQHSSIMIPLEGADTTDYCFDFVEERESREVVRMFTCIVDENAAARKTELERLRSKMHISVHAPITMPRRATDAASVPDAVMARDPGAAPVENAASRAKFPSLEEISAARKK